MSLADLLLLNKAKNRALMEDITEDRVKSCLPVIRQYIGFWREYPDIFVDFLCGKNPHDFHLYAYQRIFLRTVMRHKYTYAVFPRAYGKSFLAVLVLMLRCILYPNARMFVTTGGKEQASSITRSKVRELCELVPGLHYEIDWTPGKTKEMKDRVVYQFKNNSVLDILAARETSRGQRRTGGLIEEAILIDQTMLQEVIVPTMNVDRRLPDGTRDENEVINKSQCYVTTAGFKNTFAYLKNLQIAIQSVMFPGKAAILGGTYQVPVYEKLLSRTFINDLKQDGTFNEAAFDREYRSRWGGDIANAFFSTELFDRHRVLNQAETAFLLKPTRDVYYVIGVDVGRIGCTTEAVVIKVQPQLHGAAVKSIVNIYSFSCEHFEDQAIHLKKLYYQYKARSLVIDANGIGQGLIDFMVKTQNDPKTGDTLPGFGVGGATNDENVKLYKKFETLTTQRDAMFLMKANAPINTEIYSYIQMQMSSGKLKFLIDENQAKTKLLSTPIGRKMTADERNDRLRPFVLTTVLREEMGNLVTENEGISNIFLKQSSRSIKKDKFSALGYGLYFVKIEEEVRQKRKRFSAKELFLFN